MTIPVAVEETLTKFDVKFGVIDVHPAAEITNTPGIARAMLLQDSAGKLQVIYSDGCLLNVDAVCKLTNRTLIATPADEIQAICAKLKFDSLPSVPKALGCETVIDEQLLSSSEIKLASGSTQHLLTIDRENFKRLAAGALKGTVSISQKASHPSDFNENDDADQIITAVSNFTELRIKQRLEDTLEFPPLPETARRIIKLRADPNADIKDLTNIVESDPPLAAQVVSWAASPYYAAPGKIKSLHDAIVRVLGFDLVLNLSLGLSLGETLKMPKDGVKGFTPYWQQSVYAAAAVEALVGAIPPKERPVMGLAYLSGLLHNFGYLILSEVFPPHFSSICRYQEANPYSSHGEIENHLLGVTREQMGSWLMRLWNMPEEVCTAIRFQNEVNYVKEGSSYANLLFIAMRLLRKHGIGDAPLEAIPQSLFDSLHLDPEKAMEVIDNVMTSSADLDLMASNLAA
ncbi:MAG: HD-like signal output (HDOD) protein/prolyl-tRNA editing enzyme YbaK/EbsC (Cys-tRNA(Pro) deacylase) [Oceanicoccus sp.]|jgi:HD-like signal output (HDOD) protein/prolyl-tRNA editing enzyme YbaK/EbsC (Cys-tRNA(Pro) deacylase)